jgi:hypothetical protein
VNWVPLIVWGAVLLFGAVLLGFCAYEIVWKANRLRRDVARLQALQGPVLDLQAGLADAQERLTRAVETR